MNSGPGEFPSERVRSRVNADWSSRGDARIIPEICAKDLDVRDVVSYITPAPEAVRDKLRLLRSAILEAVPEATERLSYKMPYYDYHGRLAYFGLARQHIGLYIPTPVIDQHQAELAGLHAVQATIHLPLDQELPVLLTQKLVTARARLNEDAAQTTTLIRQHP